MGAGSINSGEEPLPTLQLPTQKSGHPEASGPLGAGVSESLKRDSQGAPTAAGAAGATVDNTFADVASYNRIFNPLSSLNNSLNTTPGSPDATPAAKFVRCDELNMSAGGLIGAVFSDGVPAPDPASPAIPPSGGTAAAMRAAADPLASDAAWGATSLQRSRSIQLGGTVAEPATSDVDSDHSAAAGCGPGADVTNTQAANLGGRCSSGAASPGPEAAQKAAQKLELLGKVRQDSYNLSDLDAEWQEVRLYATAGQPYGLARTLPSLCLVLLLS